MAENCVITIQLEVGLAKDVNRIFEKLGISASEAVTLFYKMVKRENGLPFDDGIPNIKTGHAGNGQDKNDNWLGCLEDCTVIHGDITTPVMDEAQWEDPSMNGC